jgi:hypothetical protein
MKRLMYVTIASLAIWLSPVSIVLAQETEAVAKQDINVQMDLDFIQTQLDGSGGKGSDIYRSLNNNTPMPGTASMYAPMPYQNNSGKISWEDNTTCIPRKGLYEQDELVNLMVSRKINFQPLHVVKRRPDHPYDIERLTRYPEGKELLWSYMAGTGVATFDQEGAYMFASLSYNISHASCIYISTTPISVSLNQSNSYSANSGVSELFSAVAAAIAAGINSGKGSSAVLPANYYYVYCFGEEARTKTVSTTSSMISTEKKLFAFEFGANGFDSNSDAIKKIGNAANQMWDKKKELCFKAVIKNTADANTAQKINSTLMYGAGQYMYDQGVNEPILTSLMSAYTINDNAILQNEPLKDPSSIGRIYVITR